MDLELAGPGTYDDGLVEQPDMFSMGRREAEKARAIEGKLEWYLDVEYRTLKEGACEMVAEITSGDAQATGRLAHMVVWKPWRPSLALGQIDNHTL